jgi:hypothetical protein
MYRDMVQTLIREKPPNEQKPWRVCHVSTVLSLLGIGRMHCNSMVRDPRCSCFWSNGKLGGKRTIFGGLRTDRCMAAVVATLNSATGHGEFLAAPAAAKSNFLTALTQ